MGLFASTVLTIASAGALGTLALREFLRASEWTQLVGGSISAMSSVLVAVAALVCGAGLVGAAQLAVCAAVLNLLAHTATAMLQGAVHGPRESLLVVLSSVGLAALALQRRRK
ncbi:MAG: hypothetical protein AB7N65_24230 [Vicinamibacterales bacterium]